MTNPNIESQNTYNNGKVACGAGVLIYVDGHYLFGVKNNHRVDGKVISDAGSYYEFPGGKKSPEDKNLIDTAIRELKEETGIIFERHELESADFVEIANDEGCMSRLYIMKCDFNFDDVNYYVTDRYKSDMEHEEFKRLTWISTDVLQSYIDAGKDASLQPQKYIFANREVDGDIDLVYDYTGVGKSKEIRDYNITYLYEILKKYGTLNFMY